MLAAAAAVRASGVRLERPYALHVVIGEEDGGLGAFATLQRGHRGDACVIPEPTDLRLVTANAGALSFRIEVPGLATHGATPYAGSSALDSYLAIHAALQGLQRRRNRNSRAAAGRLPDPLSAVRRAGARRRLVQQRARSAGGRGALRAPRRRGPGRARGSSSRAWSTEVAARNPYLREHPPRVSWTGGQFRGGALAPGHALRGADRFGARRRHRRSRSGGGRCTVRQRPAPLRRRRHPDTPVRSGRRRDWPTDPTNRCPSTQLITAARALTVALVRACGPAR